MARTKKIGIWAMSGYLRLVAVFSVSAAVFSPAAFCEWVQGEIAGLSEDAKSFLLTRNKPRAELSETDSLTVLVRPDTVYKGVQGIADLRAGDEVWADIEMNVNNGTWEAGSVRIDKVKLHEFEPPPVMEESRTGEGLDQKTGPKE